MNAINSIGSGINSISIGLGNINKFINVPYKPSNKVKFAAAIGVGYLANKFYQTGSISETFQEAKYVAGGVVGFGIYDKISQIKEQNRLAGELALQVAREREKDKAVSVAIGKVIGNVNKRIELKHDYDEMRFQHQKGIYPSIPNMVKNVFAFATDTYYGTVSPPMYQPLSPIRHKFIKNN